MRSWCQTVAAGKGCGQTSPRAVARSLSERGTEGGADAAQACSTDCCAGPHLVAWIQHGGILDPDQPDNDVHKRAPLLYSGLMRMHMASHAHKQTGGCSCAYHTQRSPIKA